ncbi:hypothetical protein DL769_006897 [Monosporascus sp. CRB-8-3]|nr:hypothetical protein DL769_006897 [Monosporascus sp. CRB-8-3]
MPRPQRVERYSQVFARPDDYYLNPVNLNGSSHVTHFPYQSLDRSRDEIRLLTILPPRERTRNTAVSLEFCQEPIHCLLEHVPLDQVRNIPGAPPLKSGPNTRPVPMACAGYVDNNWDDMDSVLFRLTEVFNRSQGGRVDWVSPVRKAMLQERLNQSHRVVLSGFPPGETLQPYSVDMYKRSYIWTPEDNGQLLAMNFDTQYYALSYPWGSMQDPRKITVNGHEIVVSNNLEAVLRAIREMPEIEQGTMLWVDALCINQRDNDEKAIEVRRMGEIYQCAQRVISWIGHEEDDSDIAIDFVLATLRHMPVSEDQLIQDALDPHIGWWLRQPDVASTRIGQAMVKLCGHGYWRRMWIVQELVLGQLKRGITICGKRKLKTYALVVWAAVAYHLIKEGMLVERCMPIMAATVPFTSIFGFDNCEPANNDSWTMDTILHTVDLFRDTARKDATDPRDLVYAQYALLHKSIARHLRIAYGADVRQVYANFAYAVVKGTKSLDYIQDVMFRWDWPSWVPRVGDRVQWPPAQRKFHAGGHGVPGWIRQVGPGGLQLECTGIFVGRIVKAAGLTSTWGDPLPNPHRYHNFEGLRAAMRACINSTNANPAGPTLFDDMSSYGSIEEMLSGFNLFNTGTVSSLSKAQSAVVAEHRDQVFWKYSFKDLIAVPGDHRQSYQTIVHQVLNCQADTGFRDIVVLDTGYLGSVRLNLGDGEDLDVLPDMEVWVLPGGAWPVVLWGGCGKYKMIGRCYVHGILWCYG